jgi:hypothetical protein
MNTQIPWLNREFVIAVDPEKLRAMWNLNREIIERVERNGGTNDLLTLYEFKMTAEYFRMTLISMCADHGLIKLDHGKPSDAVFKAVAKVPVKLFPSVPENSFPCDKDELLRLIEEEKGPSCGPFG